MTTTSLSCRMAAGRLSTSRLRLLPCGRSAQRLPQRVPVGCWLPCNLCCPRCGCPEAGRPLSGAGCAAAVNGRDDYCVVLPHGGGQAEHDPAASAAALAKVAALPKASQDAGGLRAAMQFVFARAVAALTQGGL